MNPDSTTTIVHALAASLPGIAMAGDVLPADIQWMPPGEHEITATRGGEPHTVKVKVDAATANRLASLLQDLRAKVASGQEDRPYIDFNHDDKEAAGHITAFSWGGDDPATGGVRALVEWTEPGKAALRGRAYRRFSPSFFVNANGEVTGAPLNMGGLVNRAAFKTIQPIWSKDQSSTQPQDPSMDPAEQLKKAQADLAAAQAQITTLNAKVATLESDQTIKAKDTEIAALKSALATLETTVKAHRKERATAKVQEAVRAGRLAPQATEVHARWTTLLEADEKNAELLDGLPVSAALGTVVQNGNGGTTTQPGAAANTAESFVALVKAKQTGTVTKSQALDAAMAENPAAYKAWRDANGKPGL